MVAPGFLFRHDLYLHGPGWIVTFINAGNQVLLCAEGRHLCSFFSGQGFNPLISFEVPFHPVTLTFTVPQTQSMGAVSVHMTV